MNNLVPFKDELFTNVDAAVRSIDIQNTAGIVIVCVDRDGSVALKRYCSDTLKLMGAIRAAEHYVYEKWEDKDE